MSSATIAAASLGVAIAATPARTWNLWRARAITPALSPRRTQLLAGVVAAVTLLITSQYTTVEIAFAAAVAAAISVVAAITDLGSGRIPKEMCWIGWGAGLFAASLDPSWPRTLSLVVSLIGVVGIPWILTNFAPGLRGGIGGGDIRLLGVYVACLSWWIGPGLMLWGLVLSSLFQLLAVRLPALLRPYLLLVTGKTRTDTADHEAIDGDVSTSEPGSAGREHGIMGSLPFAPALAAGYVAVTTYAIVAGIDACQFWSGATAC
jgi:Flp pilus assembly protein protease CpaA